MLNDIYKNKIRPIAISIIRKDNNILAYERIDDVTKDKFYRLVGGCIEFQESSIRALQREFFEELSLEIINIKLLSIFESIFTFNDRKMHEIVFLYESDFQNKEIYKKISIDGDEGGRLFKAVWVPINDIKNKVISLYPEEIINYL